MNQSWNVIAFHCQCFQVTTVTLQLPFILTAYRAGSIIKQMPFDNIDANIFLAFSCILKDFQIAFLIPNSEI